MSDCGDDCYTYEEYDVPSDEIDVEFSTVNEEETEEYSRCMLIEQEKIIRESTYVKLEHKKLSILNQNIFSAESSVNILINDYFRLKKLCMNNGISINHIDNNIYQWSIRFSDFEPSSPIFQDMIKIEKKFSYSYVEFIFHFTMDYYPFYPPMISILRPRFNGFIANHLANLPNLQLQNWSPLQGVELVIQDIKNIIEKVGNIIVDYPLNDPYIYPMGAYTILEDKLMKLSMISDLNNIGFIPESGTIELPITEKSATVTTKSTSQPTCWNKGTGYGTGNSNFNVNEYLEVKRKNNQMIISLLQYIHCEIKNNSSDNNQKNKELVIQIVKDSCLFDFFNKMFYNESMLDITDNIDIYIEIHNLLDDIISMSEFHSLFFKMEKSITFFFNRIETFVSRINKGEETPFTNFILVLRPMFLLFNNEKNSKSNIVSETDNNMSDEMKYIHMMKDKVSNYVEEFPSHTFNNSIDKQMIRSKVKRLNHELMDLSSSVPVTLSSTIWLCYCESRMDLIRFMISGPEDTPYHNGLFIFDAYFPSNYPVEPPKVILITTGKGSVRFNPNLYNCGKVCLSLLGTWSGGEGEKWNENTSTFLQVLISIQSLILVPYPYFNEPGYQNNTDPKKNIESIKYNKNIQLQTIEWGMIQQLKKPVSEFKDITKLHFSLKRDEINRQIEKWISETDDNSHSCALRNKLNVFNSLF